jgi:hemoglobin
MKIDQISKDGIRRLADGFYDKVRADTELAPIFDRAIPGDWGLHLATMRDFWSSVMLKSVALQGEPGRRASSHRGDGAAAVRPLVGALRRNVRRIDESLAETLRAKALRMPRV